MKVSLLCTSNEISFFHTFGKRSVSFISLSLYFVVVKGEATMNARAERELISFASLFLQLGSNHVSRKSRAIAEFNMAPIT